MNADTPTPWPQRALQAFIQHLDGLFILLLLPLFIYVFWASQDFRLGAKLFPMVVSALGIALIALELARRVWSLWRKPALPAPDATPIASADLGLDSEQSSPAGFARALLMFAWLLGFYVLIYLFGLLWATALFVPVFLIVQFRATWWTSLLLGGSLVGLIYILHLTLRLRWPPGVLLQ